MRIGFDESAEFLSICLLIPMVLISFLITIILGFRPRKILGQHIVVFYDFFNKEWILESTDI